MRTSWALRILAARCKPKPSVYKTTTWPSERWILPHLPTFRVRSYPGRQVGSSISPRSWPWLSKHAPTSNSTRGIGAAVDDANKVKPERSKNENKIDRKQSKNYAYSTIVDMGRARGEFWWGEMRQLFQLKIPGK